MCHHHLTQKNLCYQSKLIKIIWHQHWQLWRQLELGCHLSYQHKKKPLNQNKSQKKRNDTTSKDLSCNDHDSTTNALSNFMPNRTSQNHFKNFQQTHNTLTTPIYFFSYSLLMKFLEQLLNIQIHMLGLCLDKHCKKTNLLRHWGSMERNWF